MSRPKLLDLFCGEGGAAELDDAGHGFKPKPRPGRAPSYAAAVRTACGSFVYDHTGALAGAEIGLTQPATVEPVRVMPAKEVSIP